MIFDIDVLGLGVICIILGKINCTQAIRKYNCSTSCTPNSIIRPYNQIGSLTPSIAATYSTSIVDKAVLDCNDAFQEITPAHRVKM